MKNFSQGNVIKSAYDSIEIVINVKDNYIECIPIDSTNVLVGHHREDKTYNNTCDCHGYDETCETCNGTGQYPNTIFGFEKAEYLANNIKGYIVSNMIKNLGLK